VGLRFPIFGQPTPDWSAYKDAFAEAKRRRWHLHLYVEGNRLAETLPVLLKTGANVVVPHFGMFDPKLGPKGDPAFRTLLDAAKSRQVYVMLCGPYRTSLDGAREAAPMLLEAFGPRRLVWASDWPHTNTALDRVTTYPQMRQALNDWVPDEKARRQILVDTPARLFHFS
jgi:predicted TIM-barrel fold metal-dependent hydrolase